MVYQCIREPTASVILIFSSVNVGSIYISILFVYFVKVFTLDPILMHACMHAPTQIKCYHKKAHGTDPIFRCQFHSALVGGKNLRMVYSKAELDDAFKDKRFDDSIRVELLFDNGEDEDHNGIYI